MLLHYKFDNYRSFREKAEFDMIAAKNKVKRRFSNNYVSTKVGEDVLKVAVIVGENAGGKSNFIQSVDFLKSLFSINSRVRTYKVQVNSKNVLSGMFDEDNTTQNFELEIVADDGLLYAYELKIDWFGIVFERLLCKAKNTNLYNHVFEVKRTQKDDKMLSYNIFVSQASKEVETVLKEKGKQGEPIGLFVSVLAMLGIKHTMPFVNWMNNKLCAETNPINYDVYRSMQKEEDDLRILMDDRFLEIFRLIDYSVTGLLINEEDPFMESEVIRKDFDGNEYRRKIANDSSGVSEFFAWAVQLFRVIYEDKTVFADEMDRVLNPILADRIIAFIQGKEHKGQFIFTTHNVLHLNLKTFMKEQIYFVSKDKYSLESELYSLADFSEIRYDRFNVYEFYMKGILGGTAFE